MSHYTVDESKKKVCKGWTIESPVYVQYCFVVVYVARYCRAECLLPNDSSPSFAARISEVW